MCIGDQLKIMIGRDRYSLKDQRPKIKVSNDLISLSELVSRLVVYNPIILSNPSVVIDLNILPLQHIYLSTIYIIFSVIRIEWTGT